MDWLLTTRPTWGPAVARVLLGAVFFAHGAQKALGWFGGHGFEGTVDFFGEMGLPAPVAVLVILAEFLGSIGLVLGLLTRVAAFGILAVMVGAVAMVHAPVGFFMNWSGAQAGEGFEFHLLAIALCANLVVEGAGAMSLDLALSRAQAPMKVAPPA
ncbi:MAG: DoxX family protein [Myxococcota bacterium]